MSQSIPGNGKKRCCCLAPHRSLARKYPGPASTASTNTLLFLAPPTPPHPRRSLARKYPDSFPDVRAALTAALWEAGLQAEAEAEWQRCGDPRYRDRAWLRKERRWPPRLIAALEAFLDIRGVGS